MKYNIWRISTIIILVISVMLLGHLIYYKCFANSLLSDVQIEENVKTEDSTSDVEVHINNASTESYLTDIEYEKRRKETKSNVELTSLNEEFADIWKEKISTYDNCLVTHYEEKNNHTMIDEINTSQESWELYCQGQIDYYEKAILSEYTTGSIVPIKLSNFERNLYRERAIFLYYLCQELGIDVDAP